MQLHKEPLLDQGGSVAELSRPVHAFKKRLLEWNRKPQGRKAFRSHRSIYYNWFTLSSSAIENACIVVGGPKWSTSAIVKELQKCDYKTFKAFSRTQSMNGSIKAVTFLNERTMEHVRNGNKLVLMVDVGNLGKFIQLEYTCN